MKERPILFSAPMVRAILNGNKTQTRRVVKLKGNDGIQPDHSVWRFCEFHGPEALWQHRTDIQRVLKHICPYGQPGDQLWLRETWMPDAPCDGTWPDTMFYGCKNSPLSYIPEHYKKPECCLYSATWSGQHLVGWKPSIHMPRWASRIQLEITNIRVERLQDCSEADALAEGISREWAIVGAHCAGGIHQEVTAERYFFEGGIEEGYESAVDAYAALWESINGPGSWDANPWVWVVEFRRIKP